MNHRSRPQPRWAFGGSTFGLDSGRSPFRLRAPSESRYCIEPLLVCPSPLRGGVGRAFILRISSRIHADLVRLNRDPDSSPSSSPSSATAAGSRRPPAWVNLHPHPPARPGGRARGQLPDRDPWSAWSDRVVLRIRRDGEGPGRRVVAAVRAGGYVLPDRQHDPRWAGAGAGTGAEDLHRHGPRRHHHRVVERGGRRRTAAGQSRGGRRDDDGKGRQPVSSAVRERCGGGDYVPASTGAGHVGGGEHHRGGGAGIPTGQSELVQRKGGRRIQLQAARAAGRLCPGPTGAWPCRAWGHVETCRSS